MANPQTPAGTSAQAPPPVLNLPWGRVKANGDVYLNITAFEFLQTLWASVQGGGGLVDTLVTTRTSPAQIESLVLGLIEAVGEPKRFKAPAPNLAAVRESADGSARLARRPRLFAAPLANGHTAGTGLSGSVFDGSVAVTWTLAAAYGDSINPYAPKSANFVLAAPNGGAGVPTFRALVLADLPAAVGSVTSVSVVTANGVSGTVASPTSTPAITLTLGAITPASVAASGTVSGSNLSGTNTGDQTRGSLGAAASGSNGDITSLTALAKITGLPTYATDAAAGTAGLTTGALYCTSDGAGGLYLKIKT